MSGRLRMLTHGTLLTCVGALASCGPSITPLTVEVRDAATHEPAASVIVVGDVPSRNHPFTVATILGRTGEHTKNAATDGSGVVQLDAIDGRPVRLGVFDPDWDQGMVLIEPAMHGFDDTRWYTSGMAAVTGARVPEFRVRTRKP